MFSQTCIPPTSHCSYVNDVTEEGLTINDYKSLYGDNLVSYMDRYYERLGDQSTPNCGLIRITSYRINNTYVSENEFFNRLDEINESCNGCVIKICLPFR